MHLTKEERKLIQHILMKEITRTKNVHMITDMLKIVLKIERR